jgi:hypothetical protein
MASLLPLFSTDGWLGGGYCKSTELNGKNSTYAGEIVRQEKNCGTIKML